MKYFFIIINFLDISAKKIGFCRPVKTGPTLSEGSTRQRHGQKWFNKAIAVSVQHEPSCLPRNFKGLNGNKFV